MTDMAQPNILLDWQHQQHQAAKLGKSGDMHEAASAAKQTVMLKAAAWLHTYVHNNAC